jgi:hypothetical protein
MRAKEAKDFLVQETTQQAALDGVSLSDLEKQMMYFVENDPASCANPLELNEEFEAQFDTAEYESKIARLLHSAYKRLQMEDPEKVRRWDQAIRTLSDGDHYLPVMWKYRPSAKPTGERSLHDSFNLFAVGLLVAMIVILATFLVARYKH